MTALGVQLVLAWGVLQVADVSSLRHIVFAFVDHFEPTGDLPDPEVTMWIDDYMAMASRHKDADGRHPIHSYFVICEPGITKEHLDATLMRLNEVTYKGYGEIELHLHHGLIDESVRTEQEATADFLDILSKAKAEYTPHGALLTAERTPRCTFGFVHGMWALDNSRIESWPMLPHRAYCGVNRELDLLRQNGCYADFTFPAWGTMEPFVEDSIYYSADDDDPASYQKTFNLQFVQAGQPAPSELMIVEGPAGNPNVGVYPGNYADWPSLRRMQGWVAENVHVLGQDNWILIKLHTHGCAGDLTVPAVWDCFFGFSIDSFYSDIEGVFNDGRFWKLHYVSAREMYNIAKAAEAGMTGDPGAYRDFVIPPYANVRVLTPNTYQLLYYDSSQAVFAITEATRRVELSLKQFPPKAEVYESDSDAGPWQPSDAVIDEGEFGELHIVDANPSSYYWIVRPAESSGEQLTSGPDAGT